MTAGPIYGLMAEFETPTELVHAAKGAYAAGYRKMDTYTPYPLEEAAEAIGAHHNRVSLIVLIGAMLGMCGGYSLQYWVSAVTYPLNVGGKPVANVGDVRNALKEAKTNGKHTILMRVRMGDATRFVAVPLGNA